VRLCKCTVFFGRRKSVEDERCSAWPTNDDKDRLKTVGRRPFLILDARASLSVQGK